MTAMLEILACFALSCYAVAGLATAAWAARKLWRTERRQAKPLASEAMKDFEKERNAPERARRLTPAQIKARAEARAEAARRELLNHCQQLIDEVKNHHDNT